MTRRLKVVIVLAYLPSVIMLLAVILMVVLYLTGWRIWILAPEIPTHTPVPEQIMTEAFWWN